MSRLQAHPRNFKISPGLYFADGTIGKQFFLMILCLLLDTVVEIRIISASLMPVNISSYLTFLSFAQDNFEDKTFPNVHWDLRALTIVNFTYLSCIKCVF